MIDKNLYDEVVNSLLMPFSLYEERYVSDLIFLHYEDLNMGEVIVDIKKVIARI